MDRKRQQIGKLLTESLTLDQIGTLLDVLFSAKDMNLFMDSFRKADPDMAATIQKILESAGGKAGKKPISGEIRLASDQRVMERWNSLWRKWEEVVFEVGDEEGRYVEQEAHWEPPYFDGSALANDLEPIAEEMLALIDDAYPLTGDPDLFSAALEEISGNISAYPEWMGVEHGEGCTLGENATRCLLKWVWLSARGDPNPGSAFLNKVKDIEKGTDMVELDDQEYIDFFLTLPEETCREIYLCLKGDKEGYHLDRVHSKWHRIHHHYEEKFDASKYLETCKNYLAENWRYGLPLIHNAIEKDDPEKAQTYLGETFSTWLRAGAETPWYPEATLLKGARYYLSPEERKEISELLEIWSKVSKDLGNEERSAAVKLQSVICRAREDWEFVTGEYTRLLTPKVREVLESLISQWKDEMARESVGYGRSGAAWDTWIHWLIEAELDPGKKTGWFHEKMGKWLDQMYMDSIAFGKQWPELARLTKDLPRHDRIRDVYPSFSEAVLPKDFGDSIMGKSRRAALAKMNMDKHFSPIMKIWGTHLSQIMPDPAKAGKSEYTHHANWLKALYEINPDAYARVLSQWRITHNRRRNLWRDIRALKLPL